MPERASHSASADERWPSLDGDLARETATSLQLWGQLVGKTRLALLPMENHWWQVPFYVSARGLTTLEMPSEGGGVDVELDLVAHELHLRGSDGATESMRLKTGPLSAFYSAFTERLTRVGAHPKLMPYTVELTERVSLEDDARVCQYDPDWASRFFRVLLQANRLLKTFRGRFIGKASPVHFFWGGFDLAVTRFSGRRAPPHPGGIPNMATWVMREAYSHEVSSAGFWPGDPRFPEPAFYAYAYPEPAGFRDVVVRPATAFYEPALGEFVLPYRDVRAAADPDAAVLAFLEDTYGAAADLAGWDRPNLERKA